MKIYVETKRFIYWVNLTKIKQYILKAITIIVSVIALISACSVDDLPWIPIIILAVCLLWILAVQRGTELLREERKGQQ